MEPLAFVEVLGRHGDVQTRYPVTRWPACVGRGYDAEIILDDPYVAARHLRIEPGADGRFKLTDLGSVNGLALRASAQRLSEAEVGPDDVIRLGRTQLRVRIPGYAVAPERKLRATSFYRRPVAFLVAAAGLLGVTLWNGWIATTREDQWALLLAPTVMICVAVGVWISVWSLVSRTVGGRANFAAHGFVACAGLFAIALAGTLFEYLAFGLDARWLDYAGAAVLALLAAYMLYRHLRLNSRAARTKLAAIAVTIVLGGIGISVGLDRAGAPGRESVQGYDVTIKPPIVVAVPGTTPEAFLAEGDRLRRVADAAALERD